MSGVKSALYTGSVYHNRRVPTEHRFESRVAYFYLDLDEMPDLFRGRWLWSARRWNLSHFRRKDYLGDPDRPLKDCVLDCVEEHLAFRPQGGVRVLTQLRTWGFLFNPVSFYYCFDGHDRLAAIVAEITNTRG